MRHESYTCDRCGRPAAPAHHLDLQIGETVTPGADGVETVVDEQRRVDLCCPCLARVVHYLVAGMGFEPKRLLLDFAVKPEEGARGG